MGEPGAPPREPSGEPPHGGFGGRAADFVALPARVVALRSVGASASNDPSSDSRFDESAAEHALAGFLLAALERDPNDPSRAVASMVEEGALDAGSAAEVERMLKDYGRGGIADPDEAEGRQVVDRAVADAALVAPPSVSTDIPARLGHYRVLRTLSVGPSSAVVVAQQEAPIQREVAVKLMFEDASDPRFAARVELERQTLASLEHPNIARIYDFGVASDHRPYMVMEHVGGGSIVEFCRGRGLPLRARVALFLEACAAIRAAHTLGVLHCDLKPANILVQVVGGESHAKVIDFGIARTVRAAGGERAQIAEIPRALGTLAAMSPEALVPGGPPLDVRADVFGLGMVLLELAAMRPPRVLPSEDPAEALRIVLEEPIPRASRLAAESGGRFDGELDADLDAVIAKATARDKRARYGSVDALVGDLGRWLDGEEVTARPRLLGERIRRGFARRKFAALLAIVAVVALVPLVAGSIRASSTRDRALDAANAALAAAREIRDVPGKDERRGILLATVAEETRAGLLARPGDIDLLRVRVAGVEEELLARLMRGDPKSERSRELAREAERMRREIVGLRPDDSLALADLSVALAYKLDTIRGEPGFVEAQDEQLDLDIWLHESDPKSRLFADNLSWTYQRVADRAWERGERERSLEYLDKSGELGDIALALDPASPVSLFTAAAGHLYAMHADLVRGDGDAAKAHAFRSLGLSGALLAREPEHPRVGAFHLRAASFAATFVFDPEDPTQSEQLLDAALAAVARNGSAKQNTIFMSFPYFDALLTRTAFEFGRGETVLAARRVAELRGIVERVRYGEPRASGFSTWDAAVGGLEAALAFSRGDDAEFERSLTRAFEAARTESKTIEERVHASVGAVHRVRGALKGLRHRGMESEMAARLAKVDARLLRELEIDVAESERLAPTAIYTLHAQQARAELVGDLDAVAELDWKIYHAPDSTFQRTTGLSIRARLGQDAGLR